MAQGSGTMKNKRTLFTIESSMNSGIRACPMGRWMATKNKVQGNTKNGSCDQVAG